MNHRALHWLHVSLAVAIATVSIGRVAVSQCPDLQPPPRSMLALHVFATGVQIYRWSGTAWVFVAPAATLYADSAGTRKVGTHAAGPTWTSDSGGTVAGTVLRRCTPDSTSVPWLSLSASSTEGRGVFDGVTFIQRMHTVGGVAPAAPGRGTGEEVRVPYRAEYFFYRMQ
jgi:hypothetical protein